VNLEELTEFLNYLLSESDICNNSKHPAAANSALRRTSIKTDEPTENKQTPG